MAFIKLICEIIEVKIPFILSSAMLLNNAKASALNLIVKNLGGNVYLSGIMGVHYLIEENFTKQNIHVFYQDNNYPTYQQLWGEFIPGLFIIDYIFN